MNESEQAAPARGRPRPGLAGRALRRFVGLNRRACRQVNRLLPARLSVDGNRTFLDVVVPQALTRGATVYDLGGGSQPIVDLESKRRLDLRLVGLDISAEELAAAPAGVYDRSIVADLCTFRGDGDGDLVICQATLEHVPDTDGAIAAIGSALRPGGRAYIFVPCRNALYARLNRRLPQRLKERVLFAVSPEVEEHQGFPAPYDRCTPSQIAASLERHGLHVVEMRLFWTSSYFSVLVPMFVLWRAWQGIHALAAGQDAAETFIVVAEKDASR